MCDIIGMQNSIPITMLEIFTCTQHLRFENYVNYAGSKTADLVVFHGMQFENYVNYAGSKTMKG